MHVGENQRLLRRLKSQYPLFNETEQFFLSKHSYAFMYRMFSFEHSPSLSHSCQIPLLGLFRD